MLTALNPTKLRNEHLTRPALVYVRQSTLIQVRDNTASTTRQYQLAKRAHDLGWPEPLVVIIDQDQGRSGAPGIGRDGFEYLIAEVSLGRAGAVLCLEASRLARSSSDWYRLIEICALTDTLVIDEDGVYDPGQYNDRLLLGFRGTMSEAELHWLPCRLVGGKLEKAQQGTLCFRLPVGLVYDTTGQIVLDPDEEIQHAVRQVFEVFDRSKSALAVVKHFEDHGLQIPTRLWQRQRKGEVVWRRLRHARVLSILHNPFYAGAYVYGRTQTRQRPLPGEAPRIKPRHNYRYTSAEINRLYSVEKHPGIGAVRDSCEPSSNLLFRLLKNLNHNFIQISEAFFSPSGVRSIELAWPPGVRRMTIHPRFSSVWRLWLILLLSPPSALTNS
jgi:DNA invertase Pin-like site-specific DNA recombinase